VKKSLNGKKPKRLLIVLVSVGIFAVIIASFVWYRLYSGSSGTSQLSDPANDVVLSMGTHYPGMIDVVNGTLEANGKTLNVTINGRDLVSNLSDGEIAQWNVTVILETETDVLKTYEIGAQMNSTQLTGIIVDVMAQKAQSCLVQYGNNSLNVHTVVDELLSAKTVEWNVLTTYEQYSGGELITSASDMAPDEGLQSTALNP
jgi:hypothetical protein